MTSHASCTDWQKKKDELYEEFCVLIGVKKKETNLNIFTACDTHEDAAPFLSSNTQVRKLG